METVVLEKRKYTYEDYLKTPEDTRYELINGNLIMSPAPRTNHQIILTELFGELYTFVKRNKLGKVFVSPTDVHFDNETVVEPDILFISKSREKIITEKNIQGAPDLTIEIVSQSSIHRDMVQKKALYEKFGVKEYWLVYPDEELVEIYELKNNKYKHFNTFSKDEALETPIGSGLKGLKINLKEIF